MTQRVASIADVRERARRRLPRFVFDLVEGAAQDERTADWNRSAWAEVAIVPRTLSGTNAEPTLDCELFGEHFDSPILLAPTGASRMLTPGAETDVAAAAAAHGTGYLHGTVSGYALPAVGQALGRAPWLQVYLGADPAQRERVVHDAREAGVRVLVVTVDVPVFGKRDRDVRWGTTIPLKPNATMAMQMMTRPRWSLQFLRGSLPMATSDVGRVSPFATQRQILGSLYRVTPDDLRWLRGAWDGILLVKGVLHPDDARLAIDLGADGVIVSNHGGRQLDGATSTARALPGVVAAIDGRAPVLVDGGIRRGADVLVALALGADAVLVGRPYLYGLAWRGRGGVGRVIEILTDELRRAMALSGVGSPAAARTLDLATGPGPA